MSEGVQKLNLPSAPTEPAPQRFRSLLIPIDLTPGSDRVVGRVSLLPLAHDACLTLLHVLPKGLPPRDRRAAGRDAKKALADQARNLGASLGKSVSVDLVVKVGAAATEIAECASSKKVELIVMGRGGRRSLRDAFLGSTAERVIRRGQLPVLVVRLPPRAAYHRPAMALDLDEVAHEVFSLLLRVLPPPRPRTTIIHAFDSPYERLIYPSFSEGEVEERRGELLQKASVEVGRLLGASLARAKVSPKDVPWKIYVCSGSPRFVIGKAIKKADADLLALGTHGYSGVAHAFLGTVAGEVLRDSACDVLIVPPRPSDAETT